MSHVPGFIPFITGKEVCGLITELYADAPMAKIGLYQLGKLKDCLPSSRLWIDSGTDGLDDLSKGTPNKDKDDDPRKAWYDVITSFPGYQQIADPAFQKAPTKAVVEKFVDAALSACLFYKPAAISIPQLPHVENSGRNKINRLLAEAAAKWQLKHPKVFLILPVILNHGSQSDSKTVRNAHVKLAAQCLTTSKAQGCWIVDASFNDEDQSADKRRERMHGLVSFHQEFNAATNTLQCLRIGGPYWALNLLLWSRGLIDQFGIGVGTGYRYYLSGGFPSSGTAKIAIEPLFRRAKVGIELRDWFVATLKSMEPTHPFHKQLTQLKPLATTTSSTARRQTAIFYRSWIDSLAAAPQTGRAMTLFQSLSIAFSYGKQMADELSDEGATRRPESIAEPLMLNCL
jgi:hypothetical protein